MKQRKVVHLTDEEKLVLRQGAEEYRRLEKERRAVDWIRAWALWQRIEDAIGDHSDLVRLKDSLVKEALRYAQIRGAWRLAFEEMRRELDGEQTNALDAFIDACDILCRNMHVQGLDSSWRVELEQDRREIGDFACYLHCILSLRAR